MVVCGRSGCATCAVACVLARALYKDHASLGVVIDNFFTPVNICCCLTHQAVEAPALAVMVPVLVKQTLLHHGIGCLVRCAY
jgi:hypothetical protein